MDNTPPAAPPANDLSTSGSPEWTKQAGKYIRKYAPSSQRIFIRNSKPGRTWMRWILPIFFIGITIAMVWGGLYIKGDVDRVNGPDGAQGSFVIEGLDSYFNKNGHESIRPIVTIDNQQMVVKGPIPKDAVYAVGDLVDVYYVTAGDPVAFLADAEGKAPNNNGLIALSVVAALTLAAAVYFGVIYRGQVDPAYYRRAMEELQSGRPLPQ